MIEVLRDNVLVQEVPRAEQVTEAGLVLPMVYSRTPQTPGPPGPLSPGVDTRAYVCEGVVVLAGPGRYDYGSWVESGVKRGDRVLFHKGGATPLSIEARECLMIRAEAVLLVLERSPEALARNLEKAKFRLMSIYSEPGTAVRYAYPKNGNAGDQELCSKVLTEGEVYTVKTCRAYDSHTSVELEEFPGHTFNAVMFAEVSRG